LAKTLLITFGCSWTFGVGVNYESGMTESELEKQAWDEEICDVFSWRGLLCRYFGWINLNYSGGGSSNQRQFREAMQFFGSSRYQDLRQDFEEIIVLWGITSTARNELWSLDKNSYYDFFLNRDDDFARFITNHCYDHDAEVAELRNRILFWNMFFKAQKITNFWFDTFNTHNYNHDFQNNSKEKTYSPATLDILIAEDHYHRLAGPEWPSYLDFCKGNFSGTTSEIIREIQNRFEGIIHTRLRYWPGKTEFIENNAGLQPIINFLDYDLCPRDLMSWLMIKVGLKISDKNQSYHYSDYKIDRDNMQKLVDLGIVNPFTHHPTKQGHRLLFDYFSNKIDKTLLT